MARAALGKVMTVGILVVVIIGALVGVAVATTLGQKSSSSLTSSSTVTSSAASATGLVSISVARTTVDQTTGDAPAGYTTYIYDVTLTDSDSISHPSNASYFTLTSSGGTVYNTTSAVALEQVLPAASLSTGQHASGEVAFSIPAGDQPAQLEYKIPTQGVDVSVGDLPQPSRWVSSVIGVEAALPTNAVNTNYFVSATIENSSSDIYYSTGTIPVQVIITPYNSDDIVDDAIPDITVTSISVANQGFSIASVNPSLPVTISANANTASVDITVNVRPPSASVDVQNLMIMLSTG